MKNKRGQFYLLAAIVIVAIIIGFSVVSNTSKKASDYTIYDLKQELNIESVEVIDYGIKKGETVEALLVHFSGTYTDFAGEGKNMYFIIGDKSEINLYKYTEATHGQFSVEIGGRSKLIIKNKNREINENLEITNNKVVVDIDGVDYEFGIKPGENFYFIVSQEIGDEKYVVTG